MLKMIKRTGRLHCLDHSWDLPKWNQKRLGLNIEYRLLTRVLNCRVLSISGGIIFEILKSHISIKIYMSQKIKIHIFIKLQEYIFTRIIYCESIHQGYKEIKIKSVTGVWEFYEQIIYILKLFTNYFPCVWKICNENKAYLGFILCLLIVSCILFTITETY